MTATETLERLLAPAYTADLEARDLDALHEMKAECAEVETAVSYYRRLAQARLEILEAERERRAAGGSVEDLIADLPRILAAGGPRPAAANTRLAEPDTPIAELSWPDGRERLVGDETLANLPVLDDAALAASHDAIAAFERELSEWRRGLHRVLDGIEREIAVRRAAGRG